MMISRLLLVIGIMAVGGFIGYFVALFFVAVGMTYKEQEQEHNNKKENSNESLDR